MATASESALLSSSTPRPRYQANKNNPPTARQTIARPRLATMAKERQRRWSDEGAVIVVVEMVGAA